MYEEFFGLQRRPFSPMPDPNCFLPFEGTQGPLDALAVNCERGQGIGVLTGAAGLGKSLLGLRLALELQPTFATTFLGHSAYATRRALLQAILFELQRPFSRMAEQELRLELASALHDLRAEKSGLVLVIDEAHRLSEPLLDEVRLLTLIADAGEPLTRVVLIGHRDLEERLASPQMAAFNQRVACQVDLEPLGAAESIDYLKGYFEWAEGHVADIMTDEALAFVAKAADGIPRCLNQLADHALLLAFALEQKPVTIEIVRNALDDLKQLPQQWNDPVASGAVFRAISLPPTLEDSAVELWPPSTDIQGESQPQQFDSWNESAFRGLSAAIEIGGEANEASMPASANSSGDLPTESMSCLKDNWQTVCRDSLTAEELLADVADLTRQVESASSLDDSAAAPPQEPPFMGQVFGSRQFEFGAPSPDSFAVEEFAPEELAVEERGMDESTSNEITEDQRLSDLETAIADADLDDEAAMWPNSSICEEDSPAAPVWNLTASGANTANVWPANAESEFEEEPVIDRYVRLEAGRNDNVIWNCHAPHAARSNKRTASKTTRLVMSAVHDGDNGFEHQSFESELPISSEDAGIVESYSRPRAPTNWVTPAKANAEQSSVGDCEATHRPTDELDKVITTSSEIHEPELHDLVNELTDLTAQDEGIEELIGAEVLGLYREVQQSLLDLKTTAKSPAGSAERPLPTENLEVSRPLSVDKVDDASEPRPDTIQRAYGRLFSELRRRNR